MNPALLSRLFAAQQEPQWGPNPYARQQPPQQPPQRGGELSRLYDAPGIQVLEQEPGNIWEKQGAPPPGLPETLMPLGEDPYAAFGQLGGGRDQEGLMTPDYMYERPSMSESPEPMIPEDSYSLDRIEDEGASNHPQGLGVIEAGDRTFDYNMGALPEGIQPGDAIPQEYFGPMHGPPHTMMGPDAAPSGPGPYMQTMPDDYAAGPETPDVEYVDQGAPPQGPGPLISGEPLGEMFGPPVPPSLPRMTSR